MYRIKVPALGSLNPLYDIKVVIFVFDQFLLITVLNSCVYLFKCMRSQMFNLVVSLSYSFYYPSV